MKRMRRTGGDDIKALDDEPDDGSITVRSEGSGTADGLHIEHPEFLDSSVRRSLTHRLIDFVRKPFRD